MEGDYYESILLLNEALEGYKELYGDQHPYYAVALQNLAAAHKKNGDHQKAMEYIELAISIDEANQLTGTSTHTTKLHNLAVLLQEHGEFEKSREVFEKVIESRRKLLGENHPDYAFSLYNMAVLLQKMDLKEEAKEYFKEAISKYLFQVDNFFPYLSEKEKSAYYSKINEAFSAYHDFAAEYGLVNPSITGDLYNFQLQTKAILLNSSVNLRSKILKHGDPVLIREFDTWLKLKEEIIKLYSVSVEEQEASGISIESLEDQANALEKSLSLQSEQFSNLTPQRVNDSWVEIKNALHDGEAAVEIFRIRKNIRNDSIWYVALIVKPSTENNPEMIIFENGDELETRLFKYYINNILFRGKDTLSFHTFWEPIHDKLDGVLHTKLNRS